MLSRWSRVKHQCCMCFGGHVEVHRDTCHSFVQDILVCTTRTLRTDTLSLLTITHLNILKCEHSGSPSPLQHFTCKINSVVGPKSCLYTLYLPFTDTCEGHDVY